MTHTISHYSRHYRLSANKRLLRFPKWTWWQEKAFNADCKLAGYSDECERTVRRCLHITIFNPHLVDITHYTYLMSMDNDKQVDALIDWISYDRDLIDCCLIPVKWDSISEAWYIHE